MSTPNIDLQTCQKICIFLSLKDSCGQKIRNGSVSWNSSNVLIASVVPSVITNNCAIITGLLMGNVTITATITVPGITSFQKQFITNVIACAGGIIDLLFTENKNDNKYINFPINYNHKQKQNYIPFPSKYENIGIK